MDGHFDIRLAGNQDDGGVYSGFLEIFEEFDPRFAGHDDIGKDQVESFAANQIQSARGVVANGGLVAREPERARKRGEGVRVIVD